MSDASTAETLFFAALEKGTEAERAAYLDSACGGDAELRRQVEKLLRAHPRVGNFLHKPILEPWAAALGPLDATQVIEDGGSSGDAALALDFLKPSTRPDSLGRIGHYEVLEVLGRGGFGIVLRAFDEVLQRVVAVKVLAPQLAVTSPPRKRFLREARSSAKVRHENVVQMYAVEEEPLPYLVMEFIPGETLQQRLDRTGPLEVTDVVEFGRQIAEGLAAAHDTGLIHRDVKPGNILIESNPRQRVKITDFGLARAADDASMTQSGVVAGTPMFMAPEQVMGEPLDHRTDLFSLGSVLYTMCCGRPPFRAGNTVAVLKRVAEDAPRSIREIIPETPQWLCDVILRLHAKDPADRFQSAGALADLLARCQAEMQQHGEVRSTALVAPAPAPGASPARRRSWWNRIGLAVAAGLVLGLAGLGFTEANGVTNLQGTVIRLFSSEGTLVVEVDDPGVSVSIDGEDLVITGAGVREIALKSGRHTLQAMKDGKVVHQNRVTVARNGRQVVHVRHEANAPDAQTAKVAADASAWERSVAALPAAEQVECFSVRLKQLNPGFDGTLTPTIENDALIGLKFTTDHVTDLSSIPALTHLKTLAMRGSAYDQGSLVNLAPLQGMPLADLSLLDNPAVTDLSALKGMPLIHLNIGGTGVIDLTPLKGMSLEMLFVWGFRGTDLTPLKGMPLKWLNCGGRGQKIDLTPLAGLPLEFLCVNLTQVSDLAPLRDTPLNTLLCENTLVSDLGPLRGLRLQRLESRASQVSDLTPLKGMPLRALALGASVTDLAPLTGTPLERIEFKTFKAERDATILRAIPTLKTINEKPAAEFWKEVDEQAKD